MSYESRIIIMEKSKNEELFNMYGGCYIADVLMSRCDNEFHALFDEEIPFELLGDRDCDLTEDKYGERCCYTDLQSVLLFLATVRKQYRRYDMLYNLLKSFKEPEWENEEIIVVHYGY